jgi:hypothetical protein
MNRRTLVSLSLSAVLAAASTYAMMEDFVVTDSTSEGGPKHYFRLMDGSLVPAGLYIQALCSENAYKLTPPVTNVTDHVYWPGNYAYGYYTRPLVRHDNRTNMVVTGVDNTCQAWPAGPGSAIANVQGGDDDWYGWMRVFSTVSITGAAYYGDTDARVMDGTGDDGSSYNFMWPVESFYVTNINPAYTGLYFDGQPNKITPTMIVGSINTSVSGGNNELKNNAMNVQVSTDNGVTWSNFVTLTIAGPGNFTGTMASAILATPIVRITGANGSFPQSEPSNVLPEPAFLAGSLTVLAACFRRK